MAQRTLRIGLIGAGANTRSRHIPGLQALPDIEIVAVCNRRPQSTAAIAREYGIPRVYEFWQDVVANPDLDAIVVGTWPYLHCPIVLAALEAGKHVLTEARLSMNAAEAHKMLAAAKRTPKLVAMVVPSPFGFKAHHIIGDLLKAGYLGELREVQVSSMGAALADAAAPLSWRQDINLSGFNMLQLGILHETLLRWVPPPVRVLAQVHAFIPTRIDPESGVRRGVGTPDSVQVLAILENGARAIYHLSGVTPFGQGTHIRLYGSAGALHYDLTTDRLYGSREAGSSLTEIPIPADRAGSWQVEADFINAIRTGVPVVFSDFETGVAYMEFTEAVARSAQRGEPVELPLAEFTIDEPAAS